MFVSMYIHLNSTYIVGSVVPGVARTRETGVASAEQASWASTHGPALRSMRQQTSISCTAGNTTRLTAVARRAARQPWHPRCRNKAGKKQQRQVGKCNVQHTTQEDVAREGCCVGRWGLCCLRPRATGRPSHFAPPCLELIPLDSPAAVRVQTLHGRCHRNLVMSLLEVNQERNELPRVCFDATWAAYTTP